MKRLGVMVLAAVAYFTCVSAVYAQEEFYGKAVQAYLKKDFKAAVKYLKEYVAQKPDASAYYLLGYSTYMAQKKTAKGHPLKGDNEADEYFRQAYLIDPNFNPKSIDFTIHIK